MIIDALIVLVIIGCIVNGIIKGFVKQLSITAGLMLGFYIASKQYPTLEKILFKTSQLTTVNKIICFIIIFIIVFILIYLLGLLLKKVVQLIMLGWLDKILGGVFGFVQGVIIIWLVLILALLVFPNTKYTIGRSIFAYKILKMGSNMTKMPIRPYRVKKDLTISLKLYKITINSNGNLNMRHCD
ncbi:MAG: CvpA family protein [candidate division WOR-3 bacterium]|nr:CvpA family protein [candidate division WOR-3 bacterium]